MSSGSCPSKLKSHCKPHGSDQCANPVEVASQARTDFSRATHTRAITHYVDALQALLIAMEQGEVTIAKAGMVATLPARTAVLAAANPKNGAWICRC